MSPAGAVPFARDASRKVPDLLDGGLEEIGGRAVGRQLDALAEDLERGAQDRLGQRTGPGDDGRERGHQRGDRVLPGQRLRDHLGERGGGVAGGAAGGVAGGAAALAWTAALGRAKTAELG